MCVRWEQGSEDCNCATVKYTLPGSFKSSLLILLHDSNFSKFYARISSFILIKYNLSSLFQYYCYINLKTLI